MDDSWVYFLMIKLKIEIKNLDKGSDIYKQNRTAIMIKDISL